MGMGCGGLAVHWTPPHRFVHYFLMS
jgi:hypothetical protein